MDKIEKLTEQYAQIRTKLGELLSEITIAQAELGWIKSKYEESCADDTKELTEERRRKIDEENIRRRFERLYRRKCFYIALLLEFKLNYDRDYEPVWDMKTPTYAVCVDGQTGKFEPVEIVSRYNSEYLVYFSSHEIAQRCADMLNLKEYGDDTERA